MRLNEILDNLRITQGQLAAEIHHHYPVQVDRSLISKIASYHCLPTPALMSAICEILGCNVLDVYDYEEIDLITPYLDHQDSPPELVHRGQEPRKPTNASKPLHRKKTYRISPELADKMPADILQVCGYESWEAWHKEKLEMLLMQYEVRKGE